ncbi:MAG TPA: hypothetical protein VHZ02_10530, partial [Acidimicrobiales bacterium]|nr:hypothetical protein [Acidimicrobiales bacterium]
GRSSGTDRREARTGGQGIGRAGGTVSRTSDRSPDSVYELRLRSGLWSPPVRRGGPRALRDRPRTLWDL